MKIHSDRFSRLPNCDDDFFALPRSTAPTPRSSMDSGLTDRTITDILRTPIAPTWVNRQEFSSTPASMKTEPQPTPLRMPETSGLSQSRPTLAALTGAAQASGFAGAGTAGLLRDTTPAHTGTPAYQDGVSMANRNLSRTGVDASRVDVPAYRNAMGSYMSALWEGSHSQAEAHLRDAQRLLRGSAAPAQSPTFNETVEQNRAMQSRLPGTLRESLTQYIENHYTGRLDRFQKDLQIQEDYNCTSEGGRRLRDRISKGFSNLFNNFMEETAKADKFLNNFVEAGRNTMKNALDFITSRQLSDVLGAANVSGLISRIPGVQPIAERNYAHNSQLEFDGGFIHHQTQGSAGEMIMGGVTRIPAVADRVGSNACGWVAAHNAFWAMGIHDIHPSEIVHFIETNNGLVFDGAFGVNPGVFDRLFRHHGLESETVWLSYRGDLDEKARSGSAVVLSYFNQGFFNSESKAREIDAKRSMKDQADIQRSITEHANRAQGELTPGIIDGTNVGRVNIRQTIFGRAANLAQDTLGTFDVSRGAHYVTAVWDEESGMFRVHNGPRDAEYVYTLSYFLENHTDGLIAMTVVK